MPSRPATQPKPPEPAPAPPADPLADLRDSDDGGPEVNGQPEAPEPETIEVLSTMSQQAQDELRTLIVVGWHRDTASAGFLHRGGECGCRYLAGVALGLVAPVQATEPEPATQEA